MNVFSILPIVISIFKDSKNKYKIAMESNKEIISRLKFIGKIQKGEKINVKYMYVQPDGYATKISRTLINQDSRVNTLGFLQEIIARSFKILSDHDKSGKSSDKLMCLNLVTDLKQAKFGIINLKETYISDVKFCCDMDTLLQLIDAKLSEVDKE